MPARGASCFLVRAGLKNHRKRSRASPPAKRPWTSAFSTFFAPAALRGELLPADSGTLSKRNARLLPLSQTQSYLLKRIPGMKCNVQGFGFRQLLCSEVSVSNASNLERFSSQRRACDLGTLHGSAMLTQSRLDFANEILRFHQKLCILHIFRTYLKRTRAAALRCSPRELEGTWTFFSRADSSSSQPCSRGHRALKTLHQESRQGAVAHFCAPAPHRERQQARRRPPP